MDVSISLEDLSENTLHLQYNPQLAVEYMEVFKQIQQQFTIENDIRVSTLAKCPEVVTMKEQKENVEEFWDFIQQALAVAGESLMHTRQMEGENLQKDLLQKLEDMKIQVAAVKECYPQMLDRYRKKLEEKIRGILDTPQIEEARIATEVAIFADKICVDEEVVRLESHIEHMKESLECEENIGRKLDFIAQEMNREANTILSKVNDIKVSNIAIDLKTQIEKIREQVQNIE